MKDINRYALIVSPTQNLVDWVNMIFPDSPVSLNFDADDEATAYLIPEFMGIEEANTTSATAGTTLLPYHTATRVQKDIHRKIVVTLRSGSFMMLVIQYAFAHKNRSFR